MPWCEECAKYWAPSAMRADGACPQCGRPVETPVVTAKNLNLKQLAKGDVDEDVSAPWHFKLLMVMLAGYLGWRIIDLFT
jgi:hypothetical protein